MKRFLLSIIYLYLAGMLVAQTAAKSTRDTFVREEEEPDESSGNNVSQASRRSGGWLSAVPSF
jgi:hypothetical protein